MVLVVEFFGYGVGVVVVLMLVLLSILLFLLIVLLKLGRWMVRGRKGVGMLGLE